MKLEEISFDEMAGQIDDNGPRTTPKRHDSGGSRPGPSSLSAAAAASDHDGIGNGLRSRSNAISGKGGSSSCTTTHTTPAATIKEVGAEHLDPFTKNIDNNYNCCDEFNNNHTYPPVKGSRSENCGSWNESESEPERLESGRVGHGGVGRCEVQRKEVAAQQEEAEDIEFFGFETEVRIPWKWLRKERNLRVFKTRTRFPEPAAPTVAAPDQIDYTATDWSFKMAHPTTPITAFFKNRSVFVTGATGFLGKATVEKLLRTCPGVQTVYILIRPKSGSDVQARLQELLDNSLYDTLKQEDPDVLKKIVPIGGDITLPYLGISEEDQQTLANEVSVVIHSAATVKFDEKLKLSINVNVQGTKRIVELCKRMTKLAVLVHVSTAYANCERDEIDEKIYPPPADPNKLIQCMEWMDDDIVETITPQLIGSKPNTYTYTKALAEHILTVEAQDLPVCIVRPSIVTATWKEPVAGWVDNVNGPTGLIAACGKGVLRTLLCYRNKVADLIPLDFPVNLILSAAWYTAEHKPENIKVYNCCTGTQNPLLWGELENWGFKHLVNNPLSDVLWYPAGSFKSNRLWNNINDFFVHYIPAYMMDVVASLTGRKPIMLKVYKKITKALASLQYFTINEWRFNTDNMVALYEMLSPEDQRMFSFNVREVNWPQYIGKYCLGLRKYVMKEDNSTLPAARKHVRKLYWVHKFTQFFLILIFWRAIMFRCETARQLWSFMFGMVLRMARMLPIGEAI